MGFAISTRNMKCITNYAQAHEHFTDTTKPRTHRWASNERPLRNTRSTHLRIEANESNGLKCYDLMLYQTPMIRYYEPDADGSQAIHVQNHYSQSSQAFLWAHDWHGNKRLMLDTGTECRLMLSYESAIADRLWGDPFTARIVLRPDGTVDTKRSVHVPYFRRKSSTTLRAKRARFREALRVVFDLVELKYQEAIDNAFVDTELGRPFTGKNYANAPAFRKNLREELHAHDTISDDTMGDIVHFCMSQVTSTVDSIVGHRAWRYEDHRGMLFSQALEKGLILKDDAALYEQTDHVRAALTPSLTDVTAVLFEDLCWIAGLKEPDGRTPYPQFGKHAYRSYSSGGVRTDDGLAELLGMDTYCKLVARKGVIY